jgi:hypothetical protein
MVPTGEVPGWTDHDSTGAGLVPLGDLPKMRGVKGVKVGMMNIEHGHGGSRRLSAGGGRFSSGFGDGEDQRGARAVD